MPPGGVLHDFSSQAKAVTFNYDDCVKSSDWYQSHDLHVTENNLCRTHQLYLT